MPSAAPLDANAVLSPDWLNAAIAGRYPGVSVAAVTAGESQTTIASKIRFRVEYTENFDNRAPTDLCVKGYFSPESRQFASLGQVEARFYSEVAPVVELRVPPCVYTGIDADTGHGLILMRDLMADGSTFLTALSPYTADQVAGTLSQLARLHASTWESAQWRDCPWLNARMENFPRYVSEEKLQTLFDDGRGDVLRASTRSAKRLRKGFFSLIERMAAGPECVIHADAHAGNLYLDAAGQPGLIDWQMVQRGHWALDVAYHIGAVMKVGDRERHEKDLLQQYLETLRELGIDAPPWDQAWEDYRSAFVYGYLLWSMTQKVDYPIVQAFVMRLGTAVESHESFQRLGV